MRSFSDLTEHLTTRADDSHAAPVDAPYGRSAFASLLRLCQTRVRFFVYLELNHTLRCLCGPPSIPLSFSLATVLPRRQTYRVSCGAPSLARVDTESASFTAWTTGVSNPVRSPSFRASASVGTQGAACASGVPPDLYTFHRSTRNSTPLYPTLVPQSKARFPG